MASFRFNKEKAVAAIAFIAGRLIERCDTATFHQIFKILYFAEQRHLVKYGRPVLGDFYVAMQYGPVPSNVYDMLKNIKDSDSWRHFEGIEAFFDVQGFAVTPKQSPDMDELAESDIECLEEALAENQGCTFEQLTRKSHGLAWQRAGQNAPMSFLDIAEEAGAGPEVLAMIEDEAEDERYFTR